MTCEKIRHIVMLATDIPNTFNLNIQLQTLLLNFTLKKYFTTFTIILKFFSETL